LVYYALTHQNIFL